MYKNRSKALQRGTGVYLIDRQPVAHVTQSDFLPDVGEMTLEECEAERSKLSHELMHANQELATAKRDGDAVGISILGQRIFGFCERRSLINQRIKALKPNQSNDAFHQAVKETVDEPTFLRIRARFDEIRRGQHG